MKRNTWFLLSVFVCCTLFGEDLGPVSTLENDPAVFVGGKVNAITGQPALYSEDLIIAGVEPIRISRTYVDGSSPDWRFCVDPAQIIETKKEYRWTVWEKDRCPIVYKEGETVKIDGEKYVRCEPSNLEKGFSNTSRGKISSRTNLKNNRAFIRKDFKYLIVHAADGTVRNYKKIHHSNKEYLLLSEKLPNGNWVLYEYQEVKVKDDEKVHNLMSIRTTNHSQTKTFARADFLYEDPKRKNKHFFIVGSDGQKVEYNFEIVEGKQKGPLASVISSSGPDQSFGYTRYFNEYESEKKHIVCEKHRVNQLDFPLNRKSLIDFYRKEWETVAGKKVHLDRDWKGEDGEYTDDPRRDCVKTLSAPIGMDPNPQVTHSFIYNFIIPNQTYFNKTRVYDVEGNWTDFFSGMHYRIERIERYSKEGKCLGGEKFEWRYDTGFLLSKIHLNAELLPVFFTRYVYDERGNIIEEKFCGNLTGKGSQSFSLDANGFPLEKGLEIHSVKYRYSNGEFDLLVEEERDLGLRIVYSYLPGTDLLLSQLTYDKDELKLRHFFEYDADRILVGEFEDDGSSLNPNDLTDVTLRTMKQITPLDSGPFIGMPYRLEEKYWEKGQTHLLRRTVLTYGTGGKVEKQEIYDARGTHAFSLETKYEKGLPVEKTNPLEQVEIFSYDVLGNQKSHRDFSGRLSTFTAYDFSNRPISQLKKGDDGIQQESLLFYDQKHNLICEKDFRENQTIHRYDALGRRVETILPPIPTEAGQLVSPKLDHHFDTAGNLIEKVDGMGYASKITYNAYGKPVVVTHPDGAKDEYVYFLDGNLRTHTNPKGVTTSYSYDYLGRVLCKRVHSTEGALLAQESFAYIGKLLSAKTDAEGYSTLYEYDGAGRKLSEKRENERVSFSYDFLGRIHRAIKEDAIQVFEYDLLDRVIAERTESMRGELLREVVYEYDEAGNQKTLIRSVAGRKAPQRKKFDSLSRPIEISDPLGHVETTSYNDYFQNEFGQKVVQKTHTDAMGLKTIITCNTHSKIARKEKVKAKTLSLEEKTYDRNGLLSLQTSTIFFPSYRHIQARWTYDARNRCKTLTEAGAKTTHYSYTRAGELEQTIKPNGVRLIYEYNDLGSLVSLSSSDGSVRHKMKHNRLGLLVESDQMTRTLDGTGRVLKETFPGGNSIEHAYDAMGRRFETRIPQSDCLIAYEFNAVDLACVHRKTLDGRALYTHSYEPRDLSGNLQEEENIRGSRVQYIVDSLSRKTEIMTPSFSQQILQFDPVGNICKMRIQEEEIEYGYDDLYQLTSETGLFAHSYAYDALYNRIQKDEEIYALNSLNQVASHFEYDPNGNSIARKDARYMYDALDRLIRIETPTTVQTFTYDSQHRRLSKTTYQNGSQRTQYFLYDGLKEIGSFDEHLRPMELRILGDSPHAEIAAAIGIEIQGKIYAPVHDLQGNVAALLPLGNGEPAFYRYSAFGEEKSSGSALCPWRFSSKRTDAESGLVYFGRRYYIPEFGRWLTPDPLGFADGVNLYAYVYNDPLTHFDEYGLITYAHGQGWQNCTWNCPFSYTHAPRPNNSLLPEAWNHSRVGTRQSPSLDLYSKRSPNYYVNGMNNTLADSKTGAKGLKQTLGAGANVIPIYSESFGFFGDLPSVRQSKNYSSDYDSSAVRNVNRELLFSSTCMDALQDSRKIFVTAFSRGAADTFHAMKDFTIEQSNRFIITACGPTMILPKDLGFSVMNLISDKDWCSRVCTRNNPQDSNFANIRILEQPDGFIGHSFLNPTYQKGISDYAKDQYNEFGGPR